MTIDSPENPAFGPAPPPPPTGAVPPVSSASLRSDSPVATGAEVGAIVLVGFLANLALRESAVDSILTVVLFAILIALMVRRSSGNRPFVLFGAAGALLPWFVLRGDPALIFVNTVMVLVLLAVGAGYSREGNPFDTPVRQNFAHFVAMSLEWAFGLQMGFRWAKKLGETKTAGPVLRGIAIALPILLVFTVLLASADDVFADVLFFADFADSISHLIVSVLLAVLAYGYVSRASHDTAAPEESLNIRSLGPIEVSIILGSLALLFTGFTITQLVVALGGASHVLETEGLTQAEHARQGFFELLFASALAGGVVGAVRALRQDSIDQTETEGETEAGGESGPGRDRFVPLAIATLALTMILAAFSLQRFVFYIDAFGLTLDRVWAVVTVVAVLGLLALYIANIAGLRSETTWYPTTALLGVALLVLILNFINPSARVASYNLSHAQSIPVDIFSLASLPDDAMPEVLDNLDRLSGSDRVELVSLLCGRSDRSTTYGPIEYNRAVVASDDALDALCGSSRRVIEQNFFD